MYRRRLAWGVCTASFSSPSCSTTSYQEILRVRDLQKPQAVKHQLLTVPPALLTFRGLWDSKTICLVVSAVGILPVLTIPALVAPPFADIPAVNVIAIGTTSRVAEVPALGVAMAVPVPALPVPIGVTVATAPLAVMLRIVVATAALPAARGLAVPTVPAVAVALPNGAATSASTAATARSAAGAADAFPISGAGVGTVVVVAVALHPDAGKGGNAAQSPGAAETRDAFRRRGGCDGAGGVCSVLLCRTCRY